MSIMKPVVCSIVAFVLFAVTHVTVLLAEDEFIHARNTMVADQIVARGIYDVRVIQAMRSVQRHLFVPPHAKHLAYIDSPLPIGYGKTISQPFIVAIMTQLLELDGGERVLEIGTGSGYQAAVLAKLAEEVYTIEILTPLASQARVRLKKLGYKNITVKRGDGFLGWPEYAPFDAIIVTAAPAEIPPALVAQLVPGGRMVIPVGENNQELQVLIKENDGVRIENVIPVRFVPMIKGE